MAFFAWQAYLRERRAWRIYIPHVVLMIVGLCLPWAAGAAIDIPPGTWVAVSLPGVGKAPAGGMKHMRLAVNPLNERIYFLGGDFDGSEFRASGRNEMYSYSVADDDWQVEQAYCRTDFLVQPAGPDQVGWAWDSKRQRFWIMPGYMTAQARENCTTKHGAYENSIVSSILSFDPKQKIWFDENRSNRNPRGSKKFVHYDAKTDSLVRFSWDGVSARSEHYIIADDRWETKGHTDGVGNNARLGFAYTALDVEGRAIYLATALEGKLLRYDLDTRQLTMESDLPSGRTLAESQYPIWDSVNRVMLWYRGGTKNQIELFAYHPQEKRWQPLPVYQPEGLMVRGNNAVFDPGNNVLLLIGGYEPANPHLFLYRYAAPETLSPQAPTDLRVTDRGGQAMSF